VFALRAALYEFDKLIDKGLTAEQFEKQRGFLRKYSLQFATTSAEKLAYAIDDRYFGIGGPGHLANFRKLMGELTVADVNAAIKKYFQSKNLVIAMVTADAKAMQDALVSGKPSPISYGEIKKSKETLREDKEIEKYPLGIRADNVTIVPVAEMFQR
jgi:zinc protease